MTAERFIVDDCGTLIDMQTRDMFDIVEEVCPLLNELAEENSKLHTQNDFLKDENQHMRDLVNENRQLKQQLKELKEDVPLLLAFYRWYPFAVEKKEHQAYNRLWDFVND